jgi:hypothetical protein
MVLAAAALALLLGGAGPAKAGMVYNNAADFSPTNNPNGVWSYGKLASGIAPLVSSFSLYTFTTTFGGIQDWGSSSSQFNPNDFYNPANTPVTFGSLTLQAHQAAFHPGPNGEYSVFRFTTPSRGSYNLSATFTASDTHGPARPDPVYVLDNGSVIFSGSVQAYLSTASLITVLNLNAGDTVDFVVGDGGSSNYDFNTTALDATLAPAAPEPASLTLLGIGAAGLLGYGWRRRRAAA